MSRGTDAAPHEAEHGKGANFAARILGATAAQTDQLEVSISVNGAHGEFACIPPSDWSQDKAVTFVALYSVAPLALCHKDADRIIKLFLKNSVPDPLDGLRALDTRGELSDRDWENLARADNSRIGDVAFKALRVIVACRLTLDALGPAGQDKLADAARAMSKASDADTFWQLGDLVPSRAVSRHSTRARKMVAEATKTKMKIAHGVSI